MRGSGNIVTQSFDVSGFDQIELNTIGDVHIEQGDSESLTIETDDNILPLLEVQVKDGKLILRAQDGADFAPSNTITFRVTVRELLAVVVGGMIVTLLGFSLPEVKNPAASLMWSFVGGVIAGLSLDSVAPTIPAARTRHLFVWGSLIFLNIASVAIEGYFFAPAPIGDALPALLVQQLIAALAASWVITVLFVPKESAAPVAPIARFIPSWIWRFALATLAYVVFYFIFGGINYALVTKSYYETHAGGLDVPPVQVTLAAEVVRGALIALSVIPFLLTVPADKKRLGAWTGLLLFAIGGLVPLTMQVGVLPLFLLVASAWEIFAMNFTTGWVLARLLGRPE